MSQTQRIKDSRRTEVVQPELDLQVRSNNLADLDLEATQDHVTRLVAKLRTLSQLIDTHDAEGLRPSADLHDFLARMAATFELLALKHAIAARRTGSDVQLGCAIDPTDSGFPIFVRDVYFLRREQGRAREALEAATPDEKLVERALFSVFRGVYPSDVVREKLERNYFQRLSLLDFPGPRRTNTIRLEKRKDGLFFGRISVERLDLHRNTPRFYNLFFKATSWADKGSRWQELLEAALEKGFSTVVDAELPYIARHVENVPGLRLELIERIDIGPFYSRHTENAGHWKTLLDERPDDSVLLVQRHAVQRMGESERKGKFLERLPFWWNKDMHRGDFTPTLAGPLHVILPHRLIQSVHARNLDLAAEVAMHGTNEEGELL